MLSDKLGLLRWSRWTPFMFVLVAVAVMFASTPTATRATTTCQHNGQPYPEGPCVRQGYNCVFNWDTLQHEWQADDNCQLIMP